MFCNLWEWLNSTNGVWTGLVSAFSFLFIVFFAFRPWFYVSKKISKKDGSYKFKIINFTLVKCWDVKVYLRKVEEKHAFPKGKDLTYTKIDLKTDSYVYISGSITGITSIDRPNCIQAKVVNEDLKQIVDEDNVYLELIVTGRHGLSGLQKAKKRTFKHVRYVKDGMFESGFSTKIVT
ncbi:hypothetical protein [Maribacter sp. 2304DJ31-5]|uniref:hypothetical protein n=1 Tax=Maribacter sp. 2304DJ31-5 TaxID=3386273 RepID=UPI0039BCB922